MTTRPQFVFLDLGNVLFAFDRDRAFRQMAAVCGAAPEAIADVVLAGGLQADLEAGRIDWPAFHAELGRRTGTSSDPAALARAASDMFTLRADMIPVLAGLERIGCPFGILSNTCAIHWEHLRAGGWAALTGAVSQVVLSYEVGAAKPDRRIFDAAAVAAGVAPDRIFFTDDLPEHVAGARDAGWDAELFSSAGGLIAALHDRGLNLGL
ncbi:MAG: HAD family hydrolase [Planctomycetaceae bacterium]